MNKTSDEKKGRSSDPESHTGFEGNGEVSTCDMNKTSFSLEQSLG